MSEEMTNVAAATKDHAERVHHRNSPSTLQATEACPGYKSESGTTNEAAETGTMLHEVCDGANGDHLTDDQHRQVNRCLEYVDGIVKGYQQLFPGAGVMLITKITETDGNFEFESRMLEHGNGESPPVYVFREVYVGVDNNDTSWGYLDRAIVAPDMLSAHVIDFKFGQNPVEPAPSNLQGIAYFLGIFRVIATIKKFTVHFLTPYQHEFADKHTFEEPTFQGNLLRIQTVVARARLVAAHFSPAGVFVGPPEVEALLNPTQGTCLFCARKGGCPKAASHLLQTGEKYGLIEVPKTLNPMLVTNEDAGSVLKFLATVEAAAKAIRARLTERATNEENFMPDGYMLSLVERRSITSNQKFYDTIMSLRTEEGQPLFTQAEIIDMMSFTFGPVEKIVSAKAPRGKKEATVEELGILLEQNGATTKGEPIAVLKMRKTTLAKPEKAAIGGGS